MPTPNIPNTLPTSAARSEGRATLPVLNLAAYRAGGDARQRFVTRLGQALEDIGFFAIEGHDVEPALLERAYVEARTFFTRPQSQKAALEVPGVGGQRGYTPFGREHAKDQAAPDLKEFFQVGRVDVPPNHSVHAAYGPNVWPDAHQPGFAPVMSELYRRLDALGAELLEACALYLDQPATLFRDMTTESDTILRVIHYPPVGPDVPPGSVRAAAHEDINLITLLCGATADGLELLRRDGSYWSVTASAGQIVVDSGDMLQNLSNGIFRSTTHRVVNPVDTTTSRYSMPCFIHPRKEVSLAPLPECIDRVGDRGFRDLTAGAYLEERLREIGLLG